MNKNYFRNFVPGKNQSGIVLMLTLVILVVLSVTAYILSSRVLTQRHRNNYIMDYTMARYGCDSAVKYALATFDVLEPELIPRPNEPDFSDLFAMSEADYEELIREWAVARAIEKNYETKSFQDVNDANEFKDPNLIAQDSNGIARDINGSLTYEDYTVDLNDPNSWHIRGPYGVAWPFATEPIEFEIGTVKVKIEIEDENAKYPLGWTLIDDDLIKREADAGFEVFCEWMDINSADIDSFRDELDELKEFKEFKLEFKPITVTERKQVPSSSRRRTRRGRRSRSRVTTVKKTIPASIHTADFARFFNSSLIDRDFLAKPLIVSETRVESPLKYIGMWCSVKVNVNTAPRHVLESAFIFGGDAEEIADQIIQKRRIKPFEDIDQLKQELLKYSDSIRKCENYITTKSTFFTIRVTAVSGVAEAKTIIAAVKDEAKTTRLIAINH